MFTLQSNFDPAGDQQQAIDTLTNKFIHGDKNVCLMGVTGSGKTFTMAQVIQRLQRPALIMAHNKTLAAQLYGEMKMFFPHNHVEYFVSYYDYYQPEAYVARTDTYIEKEATINEYIERLRHSATRHLLEYDDVIVVASVSCIYGIGDVTDYQNMVLTLGKGSTFTPNDLSRALVTLQYIRNDTNFVRGTFRGRGDVLDIFPSHQEDYAWRVNFFDDEIESIAEFDALTGKVKGYLDYVRIFPNTHFIVPKPALAGAIESIKVELKERLDLFEKEGKLLERQRLSERTRFDLEMLMATGSCRGIENYSRHLTGRTPGSSPPTLFDYFPKNTLIFVDESHVTIPQIRGMYHGDFARKNTLVNFGFRLPSAVDNRPLQFEEWDQRRPQTMYVSATPGPWELEQTSGEVVEQVIRPTGLLDPKCIVRSVKGQVDDLIAEAKQVVAKDGRVLVTTLTKKMAEDLTEYLIDSGIKSRYLHSDIKTLERVEIIESLRKGEFSVLVGINLLREGLDIPECQLVAILDADKEGFLRSKVSLIQTIGRAARHKEGRVILYADRMTDSLKIALQETERRRKIQAEFNIKHGIVPKSVQKSIKNTTSILSDKSENILSKHTLPKGLKNNAVLRELSVEAYIEKLEKRMFAMANELKFEEATILRDERNQLSQFDLQLPILSVPFNLDIMKRIIMKF